GLRTRGEGDSVVSFQASRISSLPLAGTSRWARYSAFDGSAVAAGTSSDSGFREGSPPGDICLPYGKGPARAHRYAHRTMGKVAFVAHCQLNQNAKVIGGAVCAGINASLI